MMRGREVFDSLPVTPVDEKTAQELIGKCQENGWIKRGGYDWQDDPFLEDYPYEFGKAEKLEELRDFFAHGNWAIRQGIVFDDLAFVQQDNGGDEWWTLKRTPDGWLDFESFSFRWANEDPQAFNRVITSMQMATPDQCLHLEYMLPEGDYIWESGYVKDFGTRGNVDCRYFDSVKEGYRLSVYERPSFDGYAVLVHHIDAQDDLLYTPCADALTGATLAQERTDFYIAQGIRTYAQLQRALSLTDRVNAARAASKPDAFKDFTPQSLEDHGSR